MSKTTRTIIAALFAAAAGVVLWVLLIPPRDGVMGGIMCPTCVVGWVGGVLAIGLLVWLVVFLTRRVH